MEDIGVSDVRRNWNDGPPSSMANAVTSFPKGTGNEFLFSTADIANVVSAYQNDLGGPFPLVVCPLNTLSQLPVHSALLVSVTPMGSDTTRCYGLYESKWGYLGIFRHRWGTTYSPPSYNVLADTLRMFAPNPNAWGNPGAYSIYWPDPFGPSD
jgi:hypothetical protein